MSLLYKGREILSFLTSIVTLVYLSILIIYLLFSILYVSPYISNTDFLIPIYILVGIPLLLFFLSGMSAFAWFLFLVAAIGSSFIIVLAYGTFPYYSDFLKEPFSGKDYSLKQLGEAFSLNLFFSVLVVVVMKLINFTPTTPGIGEYPLWSQILLLTHASVYEEIVTRLVYVGIPVYIIYALQGRKVKAWNILGGYGKIDSIGATFMVISALIFGIAHVPSWSWWKIVPTFVGGLLLAYLFLKYGIYASIMLHFMIDFMSIPMDMSDIWSPIFSLFLVFFIIVGVFFFISYTHRAINFLSRKKVEKPKEEKREDVHPWTDLRCPNCGGYVFQFVDEETVKCLRCGFELKIKKED